MRKRVPSAERVQTFLEAHHAAPVHDLEALRGGFWSAAFAYRVGDEELVVRFGPSRDGYDFDAAAVAFDGPDLPVPKVLAVGEALDGAFAISVRHHGRFLEDVDPSEAEIVGPTVEHLLAALRARSAEPAQPVAWRGEGPSTWREWLTNGLVDDPTYPNHGWRARLAEDRAADALFRACEARLVDLRDACPERRDLVHSDLLYQNVLLNHAGDAVTAVFSWKLSMFGDFLWDVAWCSLFAPWHPGIGALDVFARTLAARHLAYMLQIAAHHLGWNAWIGEEDHLRDLMARTEQVLESAAST